MNNELFAELDFTIRRADFEKANQMIESLKKQYSPGCEEYGELCYYELLAHYHATDIYTVKYCVEHWHRGSCKFCDQVIKHSNSERKAKANYVFMKAGKALRTTSDYIPMAERHLKAKDYKNAIIHFKLANEKARVAETALTAAKLALKKNDFDLALEYLNYALFNDECYEEYKKVKKYEHIFAKFQQEIGSPKKYAAEILKKADAAKYRKYVSLSNRSGGYTDGILHFIAVCVALIVSFFMFFDPKLDIPALYAIWGICTSVALHRKFLWDFGFIKSIGGTFLLCLIPVLLTAFSDEVLDADGLGAIITIVITLIEFIPTLVRNIKYVNNTSSGKKAVALRTQFVEPTLNAARRKLVDKYAPLTDRSTATAWANTIKL